MVGADVEARDAAEWLGVHPGFESPRGLCDFPVASMTHRCILGGVRQHICSHSQKAETEVLAGPCSSRGSCPSRSGALLLASGGWQPTFTLLGWGPRHSPLCLSLRRHNLLL